MAQLLYDTEDKALLLALDGCHNFRAVAGWQTPDGKRLASGMLFRSDGLDELSDADHARIAGLSIDQVFDLRASAEIGRAPSRWPPKLAPRTWSGAESAAEAELNAIMQRTDAGADLFHDAMCQVYARFPRDLADAVGALGDSILKARSGSTLVHCAAGKDRTGFVIAMLLHAVGVRSEDVMADYLLSNASYQPAFARFNIDGRLDAVEARAPGAIAALLGVHPEYLHAAEQSIIADFGSFDAWFSQRAGLDQARRERLADRLLA